MAEEIKLTISPTHKQQLAWDALFDDAILRVFFGGGAGGGKSWLGCEWLMVLSYAYPGMKAFIGRKELKRLMSSSYLTLQKVFKHHNVQDDWKLNGQYNYLESKSTGSRIDLLDLDYQPSDPLYERFGSTEYSVGWIEEAGEVEYLGYDVLKSRVHRLQVKNAEGKDLASKLLVTFNPSKNWLYSDIYKPWKQNQLPINYAFIQSLYKDNPYISDTYGENLADIKDTAMRERLMLGNWEYNDDKTSLINYEAILDLFTNTVNETGKYLTADIARYGKDKTVIMLWNGLKATDILTYAKQGVDVTAQIIRDLAFRDKIPYSHIVVDEDGIGGGVVDILRGIKGFVANSAPLVNPLGEEEKMPGLYKENFRNLKAQCAYKLADLINDHLLAIHCEDEKIKHFLIEELEQIKSHNADKDTKRSLLAKDDVKDAIGRSPDYADNLIMRAYFFFHERLKGSEAERSEVARRLYNQFSRNYARQGMNSSK